MGGEGGHAGRMEGEGGQGAREEGAGGGGKGGGQRGQKEILPEGGIVLIPKKVRH